MSKTWNSKTHLILIVRCFEPRWMKLVVKNDLNFSFWPICCYQLWKCSQINIFCQKNWNYKTQQTLMFRCFEPRWIELVIRKDLNFSFWPKCCLQLWKCSQIKFFCQKNCNCKTQTLIIKCCDPRWMELVMKNQLNSSFWPKKCCQLWKCSQINIFAKKIETAKPKRH